MDYTQYGFANPQVYKAFTGIFMKYFSDLENEGNVDSNYINLDAYKYKHHTEQNVFDFPKIVLHYGLAEQMIKPRFFLREYLHSDSHGAVFEAFVILGGNIIKTYIVKLEYIASYRDLINNIREMDKIFFIIEKELELKSSGLDIKNIVAIYYRAIHLFQSVVHFSESEQQVFDHWISITVMEEVKENFNSYIMSNRRASKQDASKEEYKPKISDLLSITKQFFDILILLQKCGIIHKNIKDTNILITHDLVLKLTDFGKSVYEDEISQLDIIYRNKNIRDNLFNLTDFLEVKQSLIGNNTLAEAKAINEIITHDFSFPGSITNLTPETILKEGALEYWFGSKTDWTAYIEKKYTEMDRDRRYNVIQSYKQYLLNVTTSSNTFSVGLMLIRLYFGFRPFYDLLHQNATVDTILKTYFQYINKMIYFTENDTKEKDRNKNDYTLRGATDMYFHHKKKTLFEVLGDQSSYVRAFLIEITRDDVRMAESIGSDILRTRIAYVLSFLLLPNSNKRNSFTGMRKVRGVNEMKYENYIPAVRRSSESDLKTIYTELLNLNAARIRDSRLISKSIMSSKNISIKLLDQSSINNKPNKQYLNFFDSDDFGEHNSLVCIRNDNGKCIELYNFNNVINNLLPFCNHKLKKLNFFHYLLIHQDLIKQKKLNICYKCQKNTERRDDRH